MSDLLVPQADAGQRPWKFLQQYALQALASAGALSARVYRWCLRKLRSGGNALLSVASRAGSAIMSIRLPVRHSTHLRVIRQLERFERQAIAAARSIECREKRTRALLGLARTAYEAGLDTRTFLEATIDELKVEQYWLRKQYRIFSATQLCCSVAGLAARSGHAQIGHDAYLCGQQYNGKVESVDRKIGLAVAFADVAALLNACYDQVAWLATAMELACGIDPDGDRLGAVSFVARKMVKDRIPPCDNHVVDKRFAVDVAAMAEKPAEDIMPLVGQSAAPEEFSFGLP